MRLVKLSNRYIEFVINCKMVKKMLRSRNFNVFYNYLSFYNDIIVCIIMLKNFIFYVCFIIY